MKAYTDFWPADLPRVADLPRHKTKGQLADDTYDIQFDIALPQPWLNQFVDEDYRTVLFGCVWLYPKGTVFGMPGALTLEASELIRAIETKREA